MTTRDLQTLDEVIARNVIRLRKQREWKPVELAKRLGVTQVRSTCLRRWTDRTGRPSTATVPMGRASQTLLVLDCSLYELVLPNDPDTRVDLIHDLPDSPITESPPLLMASDGSLGPRSVELGLRLFRYPGDKLLESDKLEELVETESEKRRALAQEIQDRFAEYGRQLEEMFPHGLSGTVTDDQKRDAPA